MKKLLLIAISCLAIACSNEDPTPDGRNMMNPTETPEDPPSSPVIKGGSFTSYGHNLMGRAALYADSAMTKVLRLDQFTMTQGPDVRLYLSKSNNYSQANVIELAKLPSAYSNHAINVTITSAEYSDQYRFVLVYCLQFNSLFGYAELK